MGIGVAFVAVAAYAVPPGYKVTKTTESCTIAAGPADSAGVVPLVAECTWPEIDLDKVDRVFSAWDVHDEVFSAIASSVVERTEGGTAYVRQVHQARGITDRECVLAMTKTREGGGIRFAWKTAEPFTVADDRVAVAHDVGSWLFAPNPAGGVSVTYSLAYGPGGSVPGFIVRAFQGSGFEAATTELRAYLASH